MVPEFAARARPGRSSQSSRFLEHFGTSETVGLCEVFGRSPTTPVAASCGHVVPSVSARARLGPTRCSPVVQMTVGALWRALCLWRRILTSIYFSVNYSKFISPKKRNHARRCSVLRCTNKKNTSKPGAGLFRVSIQIRKCRCKLTYNILLL